MRKQGWEKILSEYIKSQENTAFEWGRSDCVLFAANGANAILEQDLTDQIKEYGDYTEEQAKAIIKTHGGVHGILDKHFQRYEFSKLAKRGDIALVEVNGTKACGIVDGRFIVTKSPEGTIRVPFKSILYAWEVK